MENKEINTELVFILNKNTTKDTIQDLINFPKLSLSSNNHMEEIKNKNNLFSSKMLQSLPNEEYFKNMKLQVNFYHIYKFKITNKNFFETIKDKSYKRYYKTDKYFYIEILAKNNFEHRFNYFSNLNYSKIKNYEKKDLSLYPNYDTNIDIQNIFYSDQIKQIQYKNSDLEQVINDYTELEFVGYKVTFKIEIYDNIIFNEKSSKLYNQDINKNEILIYKDFLSFIIIYMYPHINFSLYENLWLDYFTNKMICAKRYDQLYIGDIIINKDKDDDYSIYFSINKKNYIIIYGLNNDKKISDKKSDFFIDNILLCYLVSLIMPSIESYFATVSFISLIIFNIYYFFKERKDKMKVKIL